MRMILGIILIFFIILGFSFNDNLYSSSKTNMSEKIVKTIQNNSNYVQSNNITITGNNEFQTKAQQNGWLGSETKSDPHPAAGGRSSRHDRENARTDLNNGQSQSLNSTPLTTGNNQDIVIIGLVVTVATLFVAIAGAIEFIRYRHVKMVNKETKITFQTFLKKNLLFKKKKLIHRESMSEETMEILEEIIDENKEV